MEEQTALTVTHVVDAPYGFFYETFDNVNDGNGGDTIARIVCMQTNFVCIVNNTTFYINPMEHSEGLCVTEQEAAALPMVDEMRGAVESAFRWYGRQT